jgi:hypothetical protein
VSTWIWLQPARSCGSTRCSSRVRYGASRTCGASKTPGNVCDSSASCQANQSSTQLGGGSSEARLQRRRQTPIRKSMWALLRSTATRSISTHSFGSHPKSITARRKVSSGALGSGGLGLTEAPGSSSMARGSTSSPATCGCRKAITVHEQVKRDPSAELVRPGRFAGLKEHSPSLAHLNLAPPPQQSGGVRRLRGGPPRHLPGIAMGRSIRTRFIRCWAPFTTASEARLGTHI